MLGLKIFVRIQTFRRRPFVPSATLKISIITYRCSGKGTKNDETGERAGVVEGRQVSISMFTFTLVCTKHKIWQSSVYYCSKKDASSLSVFTLHKNDMIIGKVVKSRVKVCLWSFPSRKWFSAGAKHCSASKRAEHKANWFQWRWFKHIYLLNIDDYHLSNHSASLTLQT